MKLYIEKFRESFIIPHVKDSLDSLFYSVCYAVPFEKLQKIGKCLDDRFRGYLSKDRFGQLDATKIDFVLDLDYNNFEKQCFLINKLFMNYPKPPKTIQKQPKFIEINQKLLDISYNQPQIFRDPQRQSKALMILVLRILGWFEQVNVVCRLKVSNKVNFE